MRIRYLDASTDSRFSLVGGDVFFVSDNLPKVLDNFYDNSLETKALGGII